MKLVIELEVSSLEREFHGQPVIDGAQVENFLRMVASRCDGRVLDTPSQGVGFSDAGVLKKSELTSPRTSRLVDIGHWELQNGPLTDPWKR